MSGKAEQLTVMLVEDNSDDEELALWALKKAGIARTTIARDGANAFYEGWIAEDIVSSLQRLGKPPLSRHRTRISGRSTLRKTAGLPRAAQASSGEQSSSSLRKTYMVCPRI